MVFVFDVFLVYKNGGSVCDCGVFINIEGLFEVLGYFKDDVVRSIDEGDYGCVFMCVKKLKYESICLFK